MNINDKCGSTFPNKIKALTKKHKADIGISLDGDADRIIICDEKGNIIDGDKIIAMLAERWKRKKEITEVPMYKQVCIIPFRRDYLLKFNKMAKTNLESIESIDMNRIIEHGEKVRMVMIEGNPVSVDTKKDLYKVRKLFSLESD